MRPDGMAQIRLNQIFDRVSFPHIFPWARRVCDKRFSRFSHANVMIYDSSFGLGESKLASNRPNGRTAASSIPLDFARVPLSSTDDLTRFRDLSEGSPFSDVPVLASLINRPGLLKLVVSVAI